MMKRSELLAWSGRLARTNEEAAAMIRNTTAALAASSRRIESTELVEVLELLKELLADYERFRAAVQERFEAHAPPAQGKGGEGAPA
jgi:hypothetical protein